METATLIGHSLFLACSHNRVDEVKRLLASGADVLKRVPSGCTFGGLQVGGCLAIHACCFFSHVDCLRCLLATGIEEQLEDVKLSSFDPEEEDPDITPLIGLCLRARYQTPPELVTDDDEPIRSPTESHIATVACVKLLLDAGASLEPVLARDHVDNNDNSRTLGLTGENALDIARRTDNEELVRILEDAGRLRYSPKTHVRFPRPARYAAAEWLRLGYQIESKALVPVWAGHVLPFLVSRTSRGAVPSPPVLFFDEFYSDDLKNMVRRGAAAKLRLLQLSNVEERVKAVTAGAICDDAVLRAAAIDGSLTLEMTRAVVINRLKLGVVGIKLLKKNYEECMKAVMLEVAALLQIQRDPQLTDSELEFEDLTIRFIEEWRSRPDVASPADDE